MKQLSLLLYCSFTIAVSFAQTTLNRTMVYGGLTRQYRLYIPASYSPGSPVPLLFNLHGYTSDNVSQEYYGDFRPIADTANFIIVHPNGTKDIYGNRHWNTFDGSNIDDAGFLSTLIDTIAASHNIDLTRVYSTGMSNGGFMSYDLACKFPNRFAAVASVTGSMVKSHKNSCTSTAAVPVMQIHGTADATVPYAGTDVFTPIEELVAFWVVKNNASPTPVATDVPNTNTSDGSTATHYLYPGGTGGSTVEFYKITDGGHSWPGAPININVTNMDFSASKEIWRFFRQFTLNSQFTSIHEAEERLEVYPNPFISNISIDGNDIKSVRLIDNSGREVFIKPLGINEKQINLSSLQPGHYLLEVTASKNILRRKIIKIGE